MSCRSVAAFSFSAALVAFGAPMPGFGGAAAVASDQGPSGQEMFVAYCAPCHGRKGLGDGPVATSLKTRPTDLTTLTRNNKGAFPAERIGGVLQFGILVPAHGSTDMPTWGATFRAMGGERSAQERVTLLTRYIETLQVK
jgi:mono/diheme cytochrome c family protein